MKTIWIQWTFLIVLFLGLNACNDEHEEIRPKKERTVLVYIAGDNNLSTDSYMNVEGMMKGMKNKNGYLIVYWDRLNGLPQLLSLEVGKNGVVEQKVIREYAEENSASPATLARVIQETKKLFPADSYGLILWSHGTGWFPQNPSLKARSFGEDHGKEMDIKELAVAIPDKAFRFIIFDACVMGAIEVLYELRAKTDYIIASPTLVPTDGLPYDQVVPYFWGNESDLKKICELYYDYYNNSSGRVTTTLVKTAELDALYSISQQILGDKLSDIQNGDKGSVYSYYVPLVSINNTFYDLADFIHQVATPEERVQFDAQLEKVILYKVATPYFWDYVPVDKDRYCGISTYIPFADWTGLNGYYFTLSWSGVFER